MSSLPSTHTSPKTPLFQVRHRFYGGLVALLGVITLIGWHTHATALIQISPALSPMRYNSALSFVLCGLAVALLPSGRATARIVLGALAGSISLLTLLEYASGLGLGIDQLFVTDYVRVATPFPGRMSPLSATCFLAMGAALTLSGPRNGRTWRLGTAGLLACFVAVIAVVALFGYLAGIRAAYGWGAYTRMAVQTAVGFLVLSLSVLGWALETAHRERFDLARWLPVTGSLTLMAMVVAVSAVSLVQLQNSIYWRKHTYEVLSGGQALLGHLVDSQRGMRGYILTGQPVALGPYRSGVDQLPKQLAELSWLVQDNPAQRERVERLGTDVSQVIAYSHRLLAARDAQGLAAAIELESTGEGRAVVDHTRADLQAFTDTENRLLRERDAQAQADFQSTARLLIVGSLLATLLLALAYVLGGREMNRRRRTEAQLHGITTLQTAMLNAANYAIVSTDVNGVVTSFNSTAERWLGYSASEATGTLTPARWHDPDEVVARAQVLSAELGREVVPGFDVFSIKARLGLRDEAEWTLIRKDGTRFPVWLSVSALIDVTGCIVGYLGVVADLTERKEQEAELRLSEERFRRAFDDAPIGMTLVSPEGRLLKVNRVLCAMLGFSEVELLQTDFQSITHPEDLQADLALVRQVLAGVIPSYQMEKRYLHRDGSVVFALLSVSLVRDRDHQPLYFVSQIENISHRREMDRLKREFISTVSHELRTPLTSIRGSLGLVDAGVLGKLPEKAESMVRIAHQNSERLVRIINDILDIEKIESGRLELHMGSVELATFLKQTLVVNQAYGEKYQVHFVLDTVAQDVHVQADPDRLMQVMSNLLSNAAKFSPPHAEVRVRARVQSASVRFEVQDHGTGIPEEFRGRIFEKFAQADGSASRRFDGTGLGLSITRQLLEAMGGTIGFQTSTGHGTTFYFDLPRARAQLTQLPSPDSVQTLRHRVLIFGDDVSPSGQRGSVPRILHVEDDLDLSQVIDAALNGRAEVVTAQTLQAAEERLRKETFSLVVLDLALPDGNGLALLDRLKEVAGRSVPVLILSVTEVSREVQQRVAAALVKSRLSEVDIVQTILSLAHSPAV